MIPGTVRRQRVVFAVLVTLLTAVWGFYQWQPLRFDLIPRDPPRPNPWVDPNSKRLFRSGTRITLITAHPDDSEFYVAGLLTRLSASGARLSLIVVTDGDKGYYPFGDAASLRRTRQQEQTEAAKAWNAQEVVYLGHPDGRLKESPALVARLAQELKRLNPEYVMVLDARYPPRLTHQDHRRAGRAAGEATRQAGVGRWLLHFSTTAPNFAVDVTGQWERRWELLRIHKSQFYGQRLRQVQKIITGNALRDARLTRTRYAEGLRCVRLR